MGLVQLWAIRSVMMGEYQLESESLTITRAHLFVELKGT